MAAVPATWESLPPGPKWAMRQMGLVVTGGVSFLCMQGSLNVGRWEREPSSQGVLCPLTTCEARRCPSQCFKPEVRVPRPSGSLKVTQLEVKAQSAQMQTHLASSPGSIFNHPLPATTQFLLYVKKKKKECRVPQSCVWYKNERWLVLKLSMSDLTLHRVSGVEGQCTHAPDVCTCTAEPQMCAHRVGICGGINMMWCKKDLSGGHGGAHL